MVATEQSSRLGPAALPPRAPRPERTSPVRRRRLRRGLLLGALALVAVPAWSLGRVLLADNTDPLGVRVVEWARDHHLGGLVNDVEHYWYTHHQPKRGGTPKGGIPKAPTRVARATTPASGRRPRHNITPFVATPLPGEGVWQPAGRQLHGAAIAWIAYLRPDPIHTSDLVGVARFDMHNLRATLHAGTQLPGGGPWRHGALVDPTDYSRVFAAFNSGFKLDSSHGGYYAEGRTVAPLQDGRASFVTYADGHADIALWDATRR